MSTVEKKTQNKIVKQCIARDKFFGWKDYEQTSWVWGFLTQTPLFET
jgi:hypothetical protein